VIVSYTITPDVAHPAQMRRAVKGRGVSSTTAAVWVLSSTILGQLLRATASAMDVAGLSRIV
jgi:hypothetical protein